MCFNASINEKHDFCTNTVELLCIDIDNDVYI